MMKIELFNTLSSKKETFTPLHPGKAGVYVCGITPYDETHLGHARCYVVFDILKRVLTRAGYDVLHIQNFTDVDDKIIERANQKGVNPLTYSEPFIESFHAYMKQLNVIPANVYPRVTTHMPEIIALIEQLVLRGLAYELSGSIYYSVSKFKEYGELSKRKLEDLEMGARVEVDEKKRDPHDFALWKKAKENEPAWDSPWGKGRPGWHIECSAMSMKYLGEEFDIHGGGLDLIFPHHENEIAQSVGATGRRFARWWLHNGFVTVNSEKMSKSLGNFFTLKDILSKFDPMVVRYFLLGQHYKSPLNFSDQELQAAGAAWNGRIKNAHDVALEWEEKARGIMDTNGSWKVEDSEDHREFWAHLSNDLNTAAALGVLNKVCSDILHLDSQKPSISGRSPELNQFYRRRLVLEDMCSLLGLQLPQRDVWEPVVLELVNKREEARKSKQWALSDQLRDQLKAKGVSVEDTSTGPRLKRI